MPPALKALVIIWLPYWKREREKIWRYTQWTKFSVREGKESEWDLIIYHIKENIYGFLQSIGSRCTIGMIIGLYTLSASRRVYYSFICKEGRERERERDVIFCSSLLMKSEFSFYMLLCYIKINQHYSLQNILLFQIYVCVYKYIYIYM